MKREPLLRARQMTVMVLGAGVVVAVTASAPAAMAIPDMPLPPPYIPGVPIQIGGAYSYQPYVPYVLPPATTDTRGVRTGTNADPAQTALGLPTSRLGESLGQPGLLTGSSARYGIVAGATSAEPPSPGGNYAGGAPAAVLEDPDGAAPPTMSPPEAIPQPTFVGLPGGSGLEDPFGRHGATE